MKTIIALILMLTLVLTVSGCFGGKVDITNTPSSTTFFVYDGDDVDSSWNSSEMSYITLKGDCITLDGDGAVVDGSKVAITSAGTYFISGKLDDGQIVVRSEDKETVKLILYGVDITCSTSAPIYVFKAKKTVITLAEGTKNYVTDGYSYIFAGSESDEPNAAVFSKSDLTINGSGSLTVNANYNNGITSKDELKITGGNIVVNAVNDGIRGRDCIVVKDGNITVNAASDGMQSNNDEDSGKGYVAIEGGTLDITAGKDGIQAETKVIISGGNITISSGGGSVNSSAKTSNMVNPWDNQAMVISSDSSGSTVSAKGIKAAVDITITGGTINIDSSDDAFNSNDSLTINGGNIILASGDDGMHSNSTLEINGGDISITKCYEGLESAIVTVNNGNIHMVSSDDGINVVGVNDVPQMMGPPGQNNFGVASDNGTNVGGGDNGPPMMGQPGRMGMPPGGQLGQESFNLSSNNYLDINGGYLAIDAAGDGLDINGPINMTGGIVIINGPTRNDNGALDHVGFKMTGGFLVAVGSSGMAESPSASSTQYSVMINLTSSQPANTMVHIETEDGKEILTFVPTKAYQSIVLCSPELKNGSTYTVYCGGSSTGKVTDGIYSGGKYTAGNQITSFTISSIVTSIGSSGGGFPGGPSGDMPPGGMRR
jgi:hypothetical protein